MKIVNLRSYQLAIIFCYDITMFLSACSCSFYCSDFLLTLQSEFVLVFWSSCSKRIHQHWLKQERLRIQLPQFLQSLLFWCLVMQLASCRLLVPDCLTHLLLCLRIQRYRLLCLTTNCWLKWSKYRHSPEHRVYCFQQCTE